MKFTVKNLLDEKKRMGLTIGLANLDSKRNILTLSLIVDLLLNVLEEILDESPNIFPSSTKNKEDWKEHCHYFCSFQIKLDIRTIEIGILDTDIDVISRW